MYRLSSISLAPKKIKTEIPGNLNINSIQQPTGNTYLNFKSKILRSLTTKSKIKDNKCQGKHIEMQVRKNKIHRHYNMPQN